MAKGKIDFKYNFGIYFSCLKKYKLIIFGLLVSIIFLEVSYLIDRLLLKVIIDKGAELTAGIISFSSIVSILLILALIYVITSILRALSNFAHVHFINRLDVDLALELKRRFFNHLINLSYSFHINHKTGSLISKLTRIGGAVERMTDIFIFNFAPLIFEFIIVIISLIYFNWISAVVIVLTLVVFVYFSLHIQKIQEKSNIIANEIEDKEKAKISDFFTNVESIKYFGKEYSIIGKFREISENTKKAFLKNWDYFRELEMGQGLILSIGSFFLMLFPILDFLHGKLSIGSLVFIYTTFIELIDPLFNFIHGIRNFYQSMADFEVLFKFGKIKNEIKEKPDAKRLDIKDGTIKFENVGFNYGKRSIFKNFDLKIEKDQDVAIVGPSGGGKTTLIKLLYRLYDVNNGKILIDGEDIKDFKVQSLRENISIVPQECALFDDTIYNNIKFANPRATRKEVLDAIKFAQLDKVIKNFPKKENTIVGERGVKLSGGEKQRVSIARALLANKKILVLDEATSSLDSRTEHDIQKALTRLIKDKTTILIAHRLSTIMKADKIVVISKGKIIQKGKHKDLIRSKGLYKRLWKLQKGGYIK